MKSFYSTFHQSLCFNNISLVVPFLTLMILLNISAVGVKAGELGRRYPSEKTTEIDKSTGRKMTFLTRSQYDDVKPYQTHDTWTADGQWIVFHSNRNPAGRAIFLVNEKSGEIVQVTNEKIYTSSINLSRKEMKLYYLRDTEKEGEVLTELVEANLAKILADSKSGKMGPDTNYQRVITKIPKGKKIFGYALDADESTFYIGVNHPDATGKIPALKEKATSELDAIDIKTGAFRTILPSIPFMIGHVQANPKVPGEIAYCHETGGEAPQRMWKVRADGTENGPLYLESPMEWVTHETFSGVDEMMFILSGLNPKYRYKPTGIAVINLRTNAVRLLGQTDLKDGLFWHCNGSPDGTLAVGDTHSGKLYLIDRANGLRTLLSSKHPQRPNHLHPIFSPDSQRVLIQTGIANGGKSHDLVTIKVQK